MTRKSMVRRLVAALATVSFAGALAALFAQPAFAANLCVGSRPGCFSNLQAAVRGLASPGLAPDGLCSRLNSLVCHNTGADRFITFFYARLDGPARLLHYANAGHNAPILLHADGSHERLQAGGGVLGVFPRQKFASGAAQLATGDRLILYTDGVTEVCDGADEEFGEVRLLRLLQDYRLAAASALQEKILAVAGEFSRGRWHDDATLLVLAVS